MSPKALKKESQDVATATSRANGAVGKDPLVYRAYREWLQSNSIYHGASVLDFGAGRDAVHTLRLREEYGVDVTAFDLPKNIQEHLHDPVALCRQYDVVLASNVLNTIPDPNDVRIAFEQIASAVKQDGTLIVNYPLSPRKSSMTNEAFLKMLQERFFLLNVVGPREGKGALLVEALKD